MRVLIVDDNAIARGLLGTMLASQGHSVVGEATGSTDALNVLKDCEPDLIALDLSLANEDGLEVLKAVRRLDAQVKILIVTGNTQKNMKRDLLKAGASGFLVKPFLLREVAKALDLILKA